jgi:hypothetical protein
MPALFTRMSSPPNSLSQLATALRQSAARVTSRWSAMMLRRFVSAGPSASQRH